MHLVQLLLLVLLFFNNVAWEASQKRIYVPLLCPFWAFRFQFRHLNLDIVLLTLFYSAPYTVIKIKFFFLASFCSIFGSTCSKKSAILSKILELSSIIGCDIVTKIINFFTLRTFYIIFGFSLFAFFDK